MLVLSRKVNEKVKIGDNIWIEIVETRGGKVRLGITAPRDTPIFRFELLPIKEQKEAPSAHR